MGEGCYGEGALPDTFVRNVGKEKSVLGGTHSGMHAQTYNSSQTSKCTGYTGEYTAGEYTAENTQQENTQQENTQQENTQQENTQQENTQDMYLHQHHKSSPRLFVGLAVHVHVGVQHHR